MTSPRIAFGGRAVTNFAVAVLCAVARR